MRCVFPKEWLRPRLGWASVLGILCISLVLLSGMVQAAHFHASGTIDHDCALCVTAHHVAQAAPAVNLNFSSMPVAPLTARRSQPRPRRAVYFRLVNRPPPNPSSRLG